MSGTDCGTIRELIPGFTGRRLDEADGSRVEAHVVDCAECRAELELVQALLASRARAPSGLAERVIQAVERDRRSLHRPWWGVSAAAVAALALGIAISSDPSTGDPSEVAGFAVESEEGQVWLSDDGLLAGSPVLDELSDEALMQLLDELTTTTNGGAA